MPQKDLIACLNNYIRTIEAGEIQEQRAFKPEKLELDETIKIVIEELYNSVKKYKIPKELLFALYDLADHLDPEDQSIINVLRNPNPANIDALLAATKKIDDVYIEKNGSLSNLFKEGALTCGYVVGFLLLCLTAPILFPLISLGNGLFGSHNCFESTSVPMRYFQFCMDIFLSISDSMEKTGDAYDELTYDRNTNIANLLIGFFKPKQAEPEPVPEQSLLNFNQISH